MKIDARLIILAVIAVIVFSMQNTLPKQSVAAIEGKPCAVDADCPCMGTYNMTQFPGGTITPASNATAWGIGVASCEASKCDMTYCVDVEPVGTWLKENPWAWIKDPANLPMVLLIIGLLVMLLIWPKN